MFKRQNCVNTNIYIYNILNFANHILYYSSFTGAVSATDHLPSPFGLTRIDSSAMDKEKRNQDLYKGVLVVKLVLSVKLTTRVERPENRNY